jgi:hypothetical protein
MAARKNKDLKATADLVVATAPEEQVVYADIKEIDTSFENSRTEDFTKGESDDSERPRVAQSFAELIDSIKLGGQRTPCVGRMKGKKIQLVSGFRRYAAIKQINAAGGQQLKLKIIIKTLDDLGAHIENVTENVRQDLSGPDLGFSLYKIAELSKTQSGTMMSDRALASMVGKNHAYVNTLLKIFRKAPAVAKTWHAAEIQLGVREMAKIAAIEGEALQQEKYKELLSGKEEVADSGTGKGAGGKPWIETAIAQAEKAASVIGHLERRGCLGKVNIVWEEELETLGVRVKADANGRDRNRIAGKARKAYAAALAWVEEEEEEEEEAAE